MDNVKRFWITLLSIIVLISVCYVPYQVGTPAHGVRFLGYGWLFTHKLTHVEQPSLEEIFNSTIAETEKKKKKSIEIQKIMRVDYERILLEIVGGIAICGVGYNLTVMVRKSKN